MNVGKVAEFTTPTPAASPKSTVEQSAKKNTTTAADRPHTDRYEERSEASYTPAYTKASQKTKSETESNKNKGMDIQKPASKVSMKNEAFKSMVADIIGKQSGLAFNAIMKDADKIQNGTINDYWSADQTAQRIYDFARSLAGDDDSKLETLRKAVQTGFKQAGATINKDGSISGLPSICGDTYKQVMDKFDDWAKESKGSSSTSSSSKSGSTFKPSGYSVTNDEKKAYTKPGSSSTSSTSSSSNDNKPSGYSVTNDEKKAYKG
ncbi:MAG: hypothetical protein HDT47_07790 [Ruminococcaceae bacterium]|nr:hypothetical protein [Oscillospiraceae bacterium]